jgi:thiol:disulfide interchange protein
VFRRAFLTRAAATLAALTYRPAQAKTKQIDWNDRQLKWSPPSAGLAAMKRSGGQGLLVVFAQWCSVCHEYAKIFHDAEVVAALNGVTVMRIDQDGSDPLIRRFSPDGAYVPRTFFLGADGEPITGLYESDPEFKYFFTPSLQSYLAKAIRAMKSKNKGS